MQRGGRFLWLVFLALIGCHRAPPPRLFDVGPRTVSNQTATPIELLGEHLVPGLTLRAGDWEIPLAVTDARHAFARLPSIALPSGTVQAAVPLTLSRGEGQAAITVVNDLGFPDLIAMAVASDGRVVAVSRTTDEAFSIDPASGRAIKVATGNGPSAVASFTRDGHAFVAIAHAFTPEVWIWPSDLSGAPRRVPGPRDAAGILAQDGVAYVADQLDDEVWAIDLASGQRRWRAEVAPNPQALAIFRGALAVGSLQSGVVERLDLATGKPVDRIAPNAATEIIGGRTAGYGKYVIGGKAPRALAASDRLGELFVASIGPNVGPNPDKLELSLNSGVGVIDASGRFAWHRALAGGIDQALAIDDARGLLYVANVGLGRVRVLEAAKLRESDGVELAIPPPAGFPRFRPAAQFGGAFVGDEVHSGPSALALSPDGKTLHVLDRFSGTLAEIDVSDAQAPKLTRQIPIVDTTAQRTRRLGQILYSADYGRTGVTCEACHLEGHTEGVFFAKTRPLRIYRSPTVRGAKDTPPYFTPASTHSLAETSEFVGNRNRFHHGPMTPSEIDALTTFSAAITLLPNPFRADNGGWANAVTLPWGGSGHPANGAQLFEREGCQKCHPAPLFTTDQDGATRGRYLDVGTPHGLPIRPQLQDLRIAAFGVPSLLGSWDVFPMLTSATAGFGVKDDQLVISTRWPLRAVLEGEPAPHELHALTPAERDDLYAFLLSL